jgi:predicted enzyme related to lactoylglutathione lyase
MDGSYPSAIAGIAEGNDMTEHLRLGLVLDCRDPRALAPFWEAALGYVRSGTVANYVVLVPDGGQGPKLLLQRVAEPKVGKNRMHVDIETPLVEQTVRRLEQLGAKRISPEVVVEYGQQWVVMNDPEGNEFCVCDGGVGVAASRQAGTVRIERSPTTGP